MKNILGITTVILTSLLFACHSQKSTHSHNGSSHSHEASDSDTKDYFGAYNLEDEKFGTKTNVTISKSERNMITNALPNHKTGAFPTKGNPNKISAQKSTYTFPLKPIYTGEPTFVRTPGVALNGVKFEPGTAEVVVCDTGENFRIEAFQDLVNLGLDFNNAHVQPTGAYHYHGSPTSVIENLDTGQDLVHIGFAHDGFPMYYSKSGAYKSGYQLKNGNREGEDCTYTNPKNSMDVSVGGHHDGTYGSDFEYVQGYGDLDACNGITVDGKYMYVVTNEFPYVSRCLMGEYEEVRTKRGSERSGRGQRGNKQQQEGREQNSRPSIEQLLSHMDANKDGKLSKKEVKGPLANDFDKIDTDEDGYVTKEELENAPKQDRQGPPRR